MGVRVSLYNWTNPTVRIIVLKWAHRGDDNHRDDGIPQEQPPPPPLQLRSYADYTPVEPRLPYAADAGSYTKIWQEQSIGITLQTTITEVKEFLAHYYSGAKPDLPAIEEAIISSCRNLTFLPIMKDNRVCL
jgi:hypothetical protein